MYKNYLFDLYGTLVDINTNEWKSYLWAKMAELYSFEGAYYSGSELKKAYFEEVEKEKEIIHMKYPQYDYIDIQIEAVFDNLLKNKGIKPYKGFAAYIAKTFRAISTKYIKLYDGALDLLRALKAKGKNVYLLTNAQRAFTMPELVMLDLVKEFDNIVISSDEYTCKPDKAFYNIILDRYSLNPKESIMIGNDYITDIKGSYEAGLDSLYIHSNISSEIKGELLSTYKVMDGDVRKIKDLILKK